MEGIQAVHRQTTTKKEIDMKPKKILLIASLTAALAFTGLHQVSARGWGGGPGMGGYPCPMNGQGYQMLDEASRAKVDAFQEATVELRKKIAMKRAEKRALMRAETPDAAAVAEVEGELFDLRSEMRNRAREAGVPMMGMRGFQGRGGGPGYGMRPCGNRPGWR